MFVHNFEEAGKEFPRDPVRRLVKQISVGQGTTPPEFQFVLAPAKYDSFQP